MMVSTAVVLMVLGGALTTFKNALAINDTAAQLADANQNLRAGTNQLVRDLLMAGRIIGAEGIAMPTGAGHHLRASRAGPPTLNFDLIADTDATVQLPSISTGYQLGPDDQRLDDRHDHHHDGRRVHADRVDAAGRPRRADGREGTISADGTSVSSPRPRSGSTATRSTTRRRSRSAISCSTSAPTATRFRR